MESAGEGGAWGIALLAAYLRKKAAGETLEDFLANKVFARDGGAVLHPDEGDRRGFDEFMELYKAGLAVEKAAAACLRYASAEHKPR
jgi:hypothetical protein